MLEYRFINDPFIIEYIQNLDDEFKECQASIAGFLFIDRYDDAGTELMGLSGDKFIDYLIIYVFSKEKTA